MDGGQSKDGYDFACETDEYALSEAQGMLGRHLRAEVWLGARKVGAVVLDTDQCRAQAPS